MFTLRVPNAVIVALPAALGIFTSPVISTSPVRVNTVPLLTVSEVATEMSFNVASLLTVRLPPNETLLVDTKPPSIVEFPENSTLVKLIEFPA